MKKIFFLVLVLFHNTILFSQNLIKHIEPLSWWVNMESSNFQLLINGNNLKDYSIEIPDERVEIIQIKNLENNNYVAIDLEILERKEAFNFDINFKKKGQIIEKHIYKMGIKTKRIMKECTFNSSDVIYLITPDRFANGNKNNDVNQSLREKKINRSKSNSRHGGDIQGIIDHLDYISEMGFTAIWSTPMLENDMEKLSYHGYAITDLYKIDPRMGDNELYKYLSKKANEKGIKLIKDVVLNHIGSKHWWMSDLPSKDWINNYEKYTNTSHVRESLHDPYSVKSDISSFSDGWFVKQMPDLNQRNPILSKYIIQNSLWWIEFAQLSGFRVDTYSYSDREFLNTWNNTIQKEYPGFNIVGEEWTTDKSIIGLWQKPNLDNANSSIVQKYKSNILSLMDFPLNDAIIKSLQPKEQKWDHKLSILYRNLAQDYLYPNPNNMVTFLDNHDMSRIFCQLNHDLNYWKMAQAFLMTTRGIPQVYYGTEILLSDSIKPGDHGILREDFPGGWSGDKNDAFNSEISEMQKQAQIFMKILLNWRKTSTAVHTGELKHFAPSYNNEVYIIVRFNKNSLVMLILNNEEEKVDIFPKNYIKQIDFETSRLNAKEILTEKLIDINSPISINSKSFLLLELIN